MTTENIGEQGAHGGDILAIAKALGRAPSELIDMSSNLSPLGPVPGLKAALLAGLDELGYLPESGSETLAAFFAETYGLTPNQVLVGNGTTEFIYAVPSGFPGHRALIISPTYGDYRLAAEWAGLQVEFFSLRPEDGFALDCRQLADSLRGGELVFLCNPNNPTGGVVPATDLAWLIESHPASDFLVDESYLPFVEAEPSLVGEALPENLFVLSSFSKIYGIPGLRLGFLLGSEKKMARFADRRKPWGVNRLAQLAGEFLLRQGDAYACAVRQYLRQVRPEFVKTLAGLPGLEVLPGATHFILCRLADGPLNATSLRQALLPQGIIIRDCSNFIGLSPRYFRISLKGPEENRRFLAALTDILGGQS